jgi:RNA polymerase primary sigma factor
MVGRFRHRGIDLDSLVSEGMFALMRAIDRFDPWRGNRFSTYVSRCMICAFGRLARHEAKYRRVFPRQLGTYWEQPAEENDTGLESESEAERLRTILTANAGELTERENLILSRRFPLNGDPRSTLEEIGNLMGLTKERVRQLQNGALAKLREIYRADTVSSL